MNIKIDKKLGIKVIPNLYFIMLGEKGTVRKTWVGIAPNLEGALAHAKEEMAQDIGTTPDEISSKFDIIDFVVVKLEDIDKMVKQFDKFTEDVKEELTKENKEKYVKKHESNKPKLLEDRINELMNMIIGSKSKKMYIKNKKLFNDNQKKYIEDKLK